MTKEIIHIKKDKYFISRQDNLRIFYDIYMPFTQQKQCVLIQITHGMIEHKGRYEWVGRALAKNGFIVAINDNRAHGKSIDKYHPLGEMQGLDSNQFNTLNGFERAIEDMRQFSEILKNEFKPKSLILLGHSMGSLLTRGYMQKNYNDINAIILSGSPAYNAFLPAGRALAQILKCFHFQRFGAKICHNLSFGGFNAPFKREKNEDKNLAWLCSDKAVVAQYKADKQCRFIFSLQSFIALFNAMIRLNNPLQASANTPPIFFISGENDSCGGFGKGVEKIVKIYQNQGYNAQLKLYKNARHEILNEPIKEAVIKDIVAFIRESLQK